MRALVITCLLFAACSSNLLIEKWKPPFPINLELPESLQKERPKYERMVHGSVRTVVLYFRSRGFELDPKELIDTAIIFRSFEAARPRLAKRFGIDSEQVPKYFSGTVDQKTLLLINPERFERNFEALYPNYRYTPAAYRQLAVHELAHRAHAIIAKRRFGTEDGMGPRWLFEGLAIACAGQWSFGHRHLPWETMAQTIKDDTSQKKPLSYPRYGRLFRSLLGSFPLRFLVEHAPDKDLVARLEKDYLPSHHVFDRARGRSRGTVLLIHGSAPFNADGRIPVAGAKGRYTKRRFYADLSAALREAGWSVLRYHKPGVHWGGVTRAVYSTTDLETLSRQLRNVWRYMPEDKPRIVFAWSEGSLHVRALPQHEIDGVVLLGGIATTLADVIVAQGGPNKAKLLKDLSGKERTTMLGRDRPVGRVLDELALDANWKVFAAAPARPLLVLHGELDKEVPVREAVAFEDQLKKHDHRRYEVRRVPGRDHRLMPPDRYDVGELAKIITSWLGALPTKVRQAKTLPAP